MQIQRTLNSVQGAKGKEGKKASVRRHRNSVTVIQDFDRRDRFSPTLEQQLNMRLCNVVDYGSNCTGTASPLQMPPPCRLNFQIRRRESTAH